jgi:uncharacterized membrane protein
MDEPKAISTIPSPQVGRVLLGARFATLEAAEAAYAALATLERTTDTRIDAVIVATADADGRITVRETSDHSPRQGLRWGVVGGAVLGVIFPPSVLVTTVGLGVVGAAVGKVRKRMHRDDLAEELGSVLAPGTAGLVALAPEASIPAMKSTLRGNDHLVERAVEASFVDEIGAGEAQAREVTPRA